MAIYTYEIDHGEEEPRIGANTKIEGDIVAVQFEPVFERLERAEAALEWQPIETAPKDGTIIIGLLSGHEAYSIHYDDTQTRSVVWWAKSIDRTIGCCPRWWRPLPEAPSPSQARQEGIEEAHTKGKADK
jgi:hypothetical protein